jgi:hypothetical protein
MLRQTFPAGCALLLAAIAGCYTGGDIIPPDRTMPKATPAASVGGTEPAATAVTGVPCDVARILAKDCATCHSSTPSGGAPNPLMSYADLMAPAPSEPATTVAQLSIRRMKDTTNPMPPDGAPAGDVAALEAWYAAGMPRSTQVCDASAAMSVYDTPSVCTSNKKWAGGNRRSDLMRPGGACIECHDRDNGPSYTAAGTVYATAHEPDDCNGTSSPVQVVITDAAGKKYATTVNSVGNFFFPTTVVLTMPYKAKVVSGSKSRSMSTPQTDGDCNKCHTENGTKSPTQKQKAPGRVMAP